MEIKKPYDLRTGLLEEVLKDFDADTFDSCVTDGPYGISMMGREWDTFKRDYRPDKWEGYDAGKKNYKAMVAGKYNLSYDAMLRFQEQFYYWAQAIYRVLKPGAYVVNFCAPRTYHRMVCAFEDAGFEIRHELLWIFASGFPKSYNLEGEWEGWGTALKPSHESIMLARKPFKGTVTQNVTRYGTGALHIDACRIPFTSESDFDAATFGTQPDFRGNNYNNARPSEGKVHRKGGIQGNPLGRWPSTVIHDGSPEVLREFPYTKSGQDNFTNKTATGYQGNTYGKLVREKGAINVAYGDEGSAARFFYCPKVSPEDRNEGMPEGMINVHPTVKPTDLMRWLCRLVTPVEGLILDPFCGSGSTGKAAMYELMNFVGIDKDPKNLPIQEARIKFALQNRTGQYGIF
jgi:DNA modification methylase